MTVEDVMTRDVITVTPTTPIHEAASLMVAHGVSGLPVIDAEGCLVGIISDGDLIIRQGRRKETPWWYLFFTKGEQIAREYQRAVGTTVGEVMTRLVSRSAPYGASRSPLRSWTGETSVDCPVVLDGRLVGIVTSSGRLRRGRCTLPRLLLRLHPEVMSFTTKRSVLGAIPTATARG